MMNDPLPSEPDAPEETPQAPSGEAEKIAALQAELDTAKDRMLRAVADADNTRKRAVREREDASKYAVASFAKDLLSVADNLRRALDSVPMESAAADVRLKALAEGIEATQRALLKTFEQNGIRRIDPTDELFNPNFHEVILETPGSGKRPGTVTQVIEVGYILHDRLLRPARVGVAKDETPPSSPGGQVDTEV